eukprot:COSAG02_NODE_5909_length_3943_cov_2.182882_3_plen_169_part_00
MIPTALLLDAPANPARALAAALHKTLDLTSAPILLPSASTGAWMVLFGSQQDAATAFAHPNLQCFGQSVRIIRLGDQRAQMDDDQDEGYVVRFSDFVHEMETGNDISASNKSTDGSSERATSDRTERGAKRSTTSSEPVPKRSRGEAAYQAGPVWRSEASVKSPTAGG